MNSGKGRGKRGIFSIFALTKATIISLCLAASLILPSSRATAEPAKEKQRDYLSIFEEIEGAPNEKAYQAAIASLESYTAANPRSDGADEALLRLGRIKAAKRDYQNASSLFQKILSDFPSSRFKLETIYELASVRFRTGATSDAKAMLEGVLANTDSTLAVRAKAAVLLKDIAASVSSSPDNEESGPPAIGALLPVAGNYGKFGEEALRGIMLAANVFGTQGTPVEVIVRNAPADAAATEASVIDLSSKKRVAGLIGPLLNVGAMEAARAAQGAKTPIIALTQKENITEAGDYVFRNSLTLEAQAIAMAEYAVKTLGAKNFGVLYPQKNYGVELAKTFEKEVIRLGGTISTEVSYPAATTDFSNQIRQIFSVQIKEHKEGRRIIKQYEPKHKLDAVFIPDTHETIAIIAPYIEFFNVKNVQLLGTGGWNSQKLAERGDKSLEGAVFVDGFFVNGTRQGTMEFLKKFRDAYGFDPGPLEAQAYDAAMLIIHAAYQGTNQSIMPNREEIKDRLKAIRDFQGSSGALTYGPSGEMLKKPYFLTIKNKMISEVQSKPDAPPVPPKAK